MSITLPSPVATFLAAMNDHDTATLLTTLAPNAVVGDEEREHRGHQDIAAWSDQVIADYDIAVAVQGTETRDGETIVTTLTSGTFDGSPLAFTYFFKLAGEKIAAVRIEN